MMNIHYGIINYTKLQRIPIFWDTVLPSNDNIKQLLDRFNWNCEDDDIVVISYDSNYVIEINNSNIVLKKVEITEPYLEKVKEYVVTLNDYDLEVPDEEQLFDLSFEDMEYNISYIVQNYNKVNNTDEINFEILKI